MNNEQLIVPGLKIKIVWKGEITDSEIIYVPEQIKLKNFFKIVSQYLQGKWSRNVKIRLPDGSVMECKPFIPLI